MRAPMRTEAKHEGGKRILLGRIAEVPGDGLQLAQNVGEIIDRVGDRQLRLRDASGDFQSDIVISKRGKGAFGNPSRLLIVESRWLGIVVGRGVRARRGLVQYCQPLEHRNQPLETPRLIAIGDEQVEIIIDRRPNVGKTYDRGALLLGQPKCTCGLVWGNAPAKP
jgi:hypothetical protein